MSQRTPWWVVGAGHLASGQWAIAVGLWGGVALLAASARTIAARAPAFLGLADAPASWLQATSLIAWPGIAAAILLLAYRQAHPSPTQPGERSVWAYIATHKTGALGAVGVAWLVVLALLAPLLAPFDPSAMKVGPALQGPSWSYPLGLDREGRDMLSRALFGARISMMIGGLSVGIAATIGTLVGAVAGWAGGLVDRVLMWVVDLMLALPRLILLLAFMALWDPSNDQGILLIIGVLGLTGWMGVARIVRSETLSLRERPFVQAARALGVPDARILLRHVVPHALGPVIVYASLAVGSTILAEAALSYLGMGVQAPTPSWGNMVKHGQSYIQQAPWVSTAPGLIIVFAVMSLNLLGDGLRDALDPRQHTVS